MLFQSDATPCGRSKHGVLDIVAGIPSVVYGFWRLLAIVPAINLQRPRPLSAAVIEAVIAGLKGRYTILLVTHNLAQARRLADTVAVCWVSEGCGCVVESGPCGVLFEGAAHPIRRAYCGGEVA